jgi:hypothetical protein
MNLSKSILDLSQQSGMSIGASAEAVNNLSGFGISPQQTAQMFSQNTIYSSARDAAWGIGGDPGSAQNLRDTRAVFQQLLAQNNGNPLIANMMMQQTGKSALIPMANLPQHTFERSLTNGQGLQMGAGAVTEWQQNFSLLQSDLMRFVDFVKITLGNAFLPAMQKGLGLAVAWFKTNKEEIIDGIRAIGRYAYSQLPAQIVGGLLWVVNGFTMVTRGIANMFRGFSQGNNVIFQWVRGFLDGIDKIVAGLIKAGQIGAAALAFGVGGPVGAALAYKAAGTFLGQYQTHLATDFDKATAPKLNAQGQPIPTAVDKFVAFMDNVANQSDGISKTMQMWQKDLDPQKRGAEFDQFQSTLQSIERNTGRTPEINANINVNISPKEDFLAKILSYEQWQTWVALGTQGA